MFRSFWNRIAGTNLFLSIKYRTDSTLTLPAELLSEIFGYHADEHPPRPTRRTENIRAGGTGRIDPGADDIRQYPGDIDMDLDGSIGGLLHLSHVCRRWRRIGVREHAVQGYLGLLPDLFAALINEMDLTTPGNAMPLHITVHGSRHRIDPLPVFLFLKDHPDIASLITSFTMFEHRQDAVCNVWVQHLNACNLTNLEVLNIEGSDFDRRLTTAEQFAHFTRHLPRLSDVKLIHVLPFFDNAPSIAVVSLSARTKLYHHVDPYTLEVPDLMSWLQHHHHSLQRLALDYPGYYQSYLSLELLDSYPDRRMPLPHLRELSFQDRIEQPYTMYSESLPSQDDDNDGGDNDSVNGDSVNGDNDNDGGNGDNGNDGGNGDHGNDGGNGDNNSDDISDSGDDEPEFEPSNGREPLNRTKGFFELIKYGPDTSVHLSLWFPSYRSLLLLGDILRSLQDAGTPALYGVQLRLSSPRFLGLIFYKKPQGVSENQTDSDTLLDAAFDPTLASCEIIAGNRFSLDQFAIVKYAMYSLQRSMHVSALQIASFDRNHYEQIAINLSPYLRSHSRWVYADAGEPIGAVLEDPSYESGGVFPVNEIDAIYDEDEREPYEYIYPAA